MADLLHGLNDRKLWFPCKYFTLNAASLSVIAVAMKLPMDINDSMPYNVDQAAKLGSMAYMCTMMANILPSLASMNNKELLTNIIALDVLVITLVVNVCIQIDTGLVANDGGLAIFNGGAYLRFVKSHNWLIAIIYVVMLLFLLIIYTCSALTILKSKQILESKYQRGHETALKDLESQEEGRSTVEKLKQHVNHCWIMAGTSSPQFITVCSATTCAAGVICVSSTVIHIIIIMHFTRPYMMYYGSDYNWSTLLILLTQFIGVLLGTIAPLSRCFACLSFKVSIKWIWNDIKVYKVESYCTEKLCDWKQRSIPFKFSNRRCKIVMQNLKVLILSLCIGFQKTIVVACKMTMMIPVFVVMCVLYSKHFWNWLKAKFSSSVTALVEKPDQLEQYKDLSQYALQLQDDRELTKRTLKDISKSVNYLIQKAEKQQPTNLMKLLEGSRGFEGVGLYDINQVPPSLAGEYLECWSLTVVTLTTIAISLPSIQKEIVDKLLSGVSEGLTYVTLVEESLNSTDDYANIQKASKMLWLEVEVYYKWLGNNLQSVATQVNSVEQILQRFTDAAKYLITKVENTDINVPLDNSICRFISANSMYRITQAILLSYYANIEETSHEELFMRLSSMISDILAACLTNLPQVIALKCHTNAIENREVSVHAAAQLLGETMKIIDSLEDRELPNLNPAELPFLDKWRDYFKCSIP
uniref:uncharacterized protein LOC122588522 n=1 Tax=Erigeron canadensis TaxID=72917 RepID=UPI001CB9B1F4|nr:uncharacterized protein LOC122588522 [Erigeron canadensis]